jgi:hypothetical protein
MEGCSECKDEVVMKNRWEVGYMQVDMIVCCGASWSYRP